MVTKFSLTNSRLGICKPVLMATRKIEKCQVPQLLSLKFPFLKDISYLVCMCVWGGLSDIGYRYWHRMLHITFQKHIAIWKSQILFDDLCLFSFLMENGHGKTASTIRFGAKGLNFQSQTQNQGLQT